jgi:hypothetical protein
MCGRYTSTADVQQPYDRFKVPIQSAAGTRRPAEGAKGVFLWLSWASDLSRYFAGACGVAANFVVIDDDGRRYGEACGDRSDC